MELRNGDITLVEEALFSYGTDIRVEKKNGKRKEEATIQSRRRGEIKRYVGVEIQMEEKTKRGERGKPPGVMFKLTYQSWEETPSNQSRKRKGTIGQCRSECLGSSKTACFKFDKALEGSGVAP